MCHHLLSRLKPDGMREGIKVNSFCLKELLACKTAADFLILVSHFRSPAGFGGLVFPTHSHYSLSHRLHLSARPFLSCLLLKISHMLCPVRAGGTPQVEPLLGSHWPPSFMLPLGILGRKGREVRKFSLIQMTKWFDSLTSEWPWNRIQILCYL